MFRLKTFLARCLGTVALGALLLGGSVAAPIGDTAQAANFRLEFVGRHSGGGETAAEIAAYDRVTQRLFITNARDNKLMIVSIADPANPVEIAAIDLSPYGGGPNSVAVSRRKIAVAVEANVKTDPGSVVFFDADGKFRSKVTVGALPDMVTFTPDGNWLLVANEGEPNSYNQPDSVDPEGSVSIINTSHTTVNQSDVRSAHFRRFNGQEAELRAQGIRIFGPNATAAQDFEPEYVAVSADSKTAWVTLQENNALAIVDIERAVVKRVVPLGYKNHGRAGNELDASDRDGAINIRRWRNVFGMYMPDAIASYEVDGQTYLVTANEGDARDYTGFAEEARVKDLTLDPLVFTNPKVQDDNRLGRLTVTTANGDDNKDGSFEKLYAFGARSFSIWNARGKLVYDSGAELEKITAAAFPDFFNSDHAETSFDNRSDNKGPEPEGVAVGKAFNRNFAFIGMERIGGVATFDVSDPKAPVFVDYVNTRNFGAASPAEAGDVGPEGMMFIRANQSPTGEPLVVVTNEISGTTAIYALRRGKRPEVAAR